MTIEKSPTPTEAKPPAASGTKGASSTKDKSGKPQGADAAGFMAILATVDAEVASSVGVDTASSTSEDASEAVPAPLIANPVDIASAQAAIDATGLLAQAAQLLTTPSASARELNAAQLATQTASPQALSPLGRLPKGPADAAMPVALPMEQTTDALPQGARKPTKGQIDLGTMGQQTNTAATNASTAASAAADARAAQVVARVQAQAAVAELAPTVLAAVVNSVRREDEGRERSVFKAASPEGVITGTTSAQTITAPMGASSSSALPSAADLYVAEQVKYWISNDVKNAEMKLDGIGNHPVEVSISMQGNEAHVVFRSDESQARDVLEAASSHLKDLLHREGLVLSGVSVGTTGSGDTSAQERREQQAARQPRSMGATQVASIQGGPSAARTSGRALDLFV